MIQNGPFGPIVISGEVVETYEARSRSEVSPAGPKLADPMGVLGRAIDSGARIRVIYGPPGTGKTTTLFAKAEEAARKWGPHAVMVTSMTRAAAAEVQSRTESGFGSVLPPSQIGTLHSWALRALDDPGDHVSKRWKEWNEEAGVTYPFSQNYFRGSSADEAAERSPVRSAFLDDRAQGDGLGDIAHTAYTLARARSLDWRLDKGIGEYRDFAERWEKWKEENGCSDFDDWIERARTENTAPPAGVRIIYVDEAQDHSPLELALIAHWATQVEAVVLLGDPDQTIMRFRGADPSVFLAVPAEHKHTLSQSYRVPARVHEYALDWVRRIASREDVKYTPKEEPGEVRLLPWSFRRCEPLVARARRHYEAKETCLFLGATRGVVKDLVKALKAAGLPIGNPYAPHRGEFNPMRGIERARAFYAPRKDVWGSRAHVWTWGEFCKFFDGISSEHLERGCKAHVMRLAKDANTKDTPVADSLEACWDVLDGFVETRQVRDLLDLQAISTATAAPRYQYAVAIEEHLGPDALVEDPRIFVGTIHSVKGGQAQHVYVSPELGGFSDAWIYGTETARDDVIRLFYVAFTRAQKALYLCAPNKQGRGIQW